MMSMGEMRSVMLIMEWRWAWQWYVLTVVMVIGSTLVMWEVQTDGTFSSVGIWSLILCLVVSPKLPQEIQTNSKLPSSKVDVASGSSQTLTSTLNTTLMVPGDPPWTFPSSSSEVGI